MNSRNDVNRWAAFGQWLRLRREAAAITQHEAALRCGITQQQWWRLEHGASGTGYNRISAIAAAIGADEADAYYNAGFIAPGSVDRERVYDDLPPGLLEVAGLHGRALNHLPPGAQRDAYLARLREEALAALLDIDSRVELRR